MGFCKVLQVVKVKVLFNKSLQYYKIEDHILLKKGMLFVGTTKFGNDLVEINCPSKVELTEEEWHENLKKTGSVKDQNTSRFSFEPTLCHPAKESELEQYQNNRKKAEELLPLFKEKIKQYNLDMKIVELHFTLDKERLVCSYTAESRIDFREFVKDIGVKLKQRIEMFQIDVRESMTLLDVCGSCGRQLCCSMGCSSLNIDKKMSSKTSKFLGVCGKTRCCSFYEN